MASLLGGRPLRASLLVILLGSTSLLVLGLLLPRGASGARLRADPSKPRFAKRLQKAFQKATQRRPGGPSPQQQQQSLEEEKGKEREEDPSVRPCPTEFPLLERHEGEAWHGDVCRPLPGSLSLPFAKNSEKAAGGGSEAAAFARAKERGWVCPRTCVEKDEKSGSAPWCTMANNPSLPCRWVLQPCPATFPVLEKHGEPTHGDVCREEQTSGGKFGTSWVCPVGCTVAPPHSEPLYSSSSFGAVRRKMGETPPWCISSVAPGTSSSQQSPCRSGGVASCVCETDSPEWLDFEGQARSSLMAHGQAGPPAAPRPARCVFIDLGASNGNSYQTFLASDRTKAFDTGGFEPSECSAILVEANPVFTEALRKTAAHYQPEGKDVRVLPSTAAFMCDRNSAPFFVDTLSHAADNSSHYWGSSLSPQHPDARRSGYQVANAPTVNLNRLLKENVRLEDHVVVKMDIEGAEWDILPCLARSPAANLVDVLYVEKHPHTWGLEGNADQSWQDAMQRLQKRGVRIPRYFSQTFML